MQKNIQTSYLEAGDATLTKRIKKRCKETGFEIITERSWNGFGYRIDGYQVPIEIYQEEKAVREREIEIAREKEIRLENERKAEKYKAQIQDLTQRFPLLTLRQIKSIASETVYDNIGYRYKVATKRYWHHLGYDAVDKHCGFHVAGAKVMKVFSPLKERPIKESPEKNMGSLGEDQRRSNCIGGVNSFCQSATKSNESEGFL